MNAYHQPALTEFGVFELWKPEPVEAETPEFAAPQKQPAPDVFAKLGSPGEPKLAEPAEHTVYSEQNALSWLAVPLLEVQRELVVAPARLLGGHLSWAAAVPLPKEARTEEAAKPEA